MAKTQQQDGSITDEAGKVIVATPNVKIKVPEPVAVKEAPEPEGESVGAETPPRRRR